MSKFSGKCDLYDILIMIREMNDESDWSKIKICQYINELDENNFHKSISLEINNMKDLVPYYPFIECISSGNKDEYHCIIGMHSFIYTEEKERLNYILKKAQKEYRKCKRNKVDFNVDEIAKKITFVGKVDENTLEICKRVKEHPYSAKLDGLSTSLHNYYRERLMEEMIHYGYTKEQAYEWCYHENKTW